MVSIIIPFNNSKYLDNCLNNISKIKYDDFEVILINDEKDEKSIKIVEKYISKVNIKYYDTKKDTIGAGNARNLGIEKSKGEYIMFIDVDDTIDENILAKLHIYIQKNVEMIKYKMKIIGEKEIYIDGPVFEVTTGEEAFNKLCYKDKYLDSPCLYLINRELIERSNLKFEEDVFHEDFGLIPRLILKAKSMVSVKIYGYNYFQSENSIMRNNKYSNAIKRVEDKFKHYENLIEDLNRYKLKNNTKTNILNFYANSIIYAIKDLKPEDRKVYIKYFKNQSVAHKLIFYNLISYNFLNLIKYIIIQINMEMYFRWQK